MHQRLARKSWRFWFQYLWAVLLAVGLPCFWVPGVAWADEPAVPMHQRIDRLLGGASWVAPLATDGEFLRRVSLDLVGVVPTTSEARAFLDDPSPYKRTRLIDRLLNDRRYPRHMAVVFDTILMERRPDVHVPDVEWREFLRSSFERNVPYDELVRAILASDGRDPARRAAAKFSLDRESDPNLLVRDIGRIFLGRDMQCAQCHDHPLIDDYKQAHYYGLFAFLSRTSVGKDGSGTSVLAEKADGDVTFSSVFKKKDSHQTRPHLLDDPELAEAEPPAAGMAYWVFPDSKLATIPRVSRRALLPDQLTASNRPEFAQTIANRLWAHMMGRGLIHPVDLAHSENPPSNPELLELLTQEMTAHRFDVRAFLREIALSQVYQRTSEPDPALAASAQEEDPFVVSRLRPLTPEQLGLSMMEALGVTGQVTEAVERELTITDPRMRDILTHAPGPGSLRDELIERRVETRLRGGLAAFVRQFACAPGQLQDTAQATVHQALFLANGEPLQGWLRPSGKNLAARLAAQSDPAALADELYLSILSRRPTGEERQEVEKVLADNASDRAFAVRELAWALLASAEFRFNH